MHFLRHTLSLLVLLLLVPALTAQPLNQTSRRIQGFAAPPATCNFAVSVTDFGSDTAAGKLYLCTAANTWTLIGPGGAPSYPLFVPAGTTAAPTIALASDHSTGWHFTATAFIWGSGGTNNDLVCGQGCTTVTGGTYGWSSSATDATAAADTTIARAGAKSINVGVNGDATGTVNAATFVGALTGTASGNLVSGGALGTPSSGTLTNATGLPVGGISGLGTGVGTFLGTPSSANLRSALTDKSGTGAALFANGNIGSATGTVLTLGSGTQLYSLDIYGALSGGQGIHLSTSDADSGGYVFSNSANNAYFTAGVYFNGTNFIAKTTTPTAVNVAGGSINFFADTGKTVGASYTPTQVMTVSGTGLNVTGSITPSTTGGVVGTTTNNNATAGSIGEFTNAQCPGPTTTATVTITIASPGVVTWSSHPFNGTAPRFDACPVVFTTSGALPTGITTGTTYWVIPTTISGNNFSVATSVANAIAGTAVNTSGTQSGTHTGTAGSPLTTATAKDVTGLALTAGDWDCSAVLARGLAGTTSVTLLKTSISGTSATDGTIPAGTMIQFTEAATVLGNDITEGMGPVRVLNSGTANTFLVADDTFTVSTNKAYGTLRCRRVR